MFSETPVTPVTRPGTWDTMPVAAPDGAEGAHDVGDIAGRGADQAAGNVEEATGDGVQLGVGDLTGLKVVTHGAHLSLGGSNTYLRRPWAQNSARHS
ncbi:hypothetical protein GCM10020254_18930 [Streptomyces goshikiensis]